MNLKTVGDKTILYVMAAELEYGVHLQKRFKPLLTGIGPVEAALSLSNALNQLSKKPDLVVCLGSAGSATLQQTKIYQVSSIAYRDMDVSALGYEKGVTPFLDIQASIALDITIEGIESASLSSGAGIVSGKAYEDIDAQMVDMETFAIKRCCMQHDIPMIGLRGISDGKEELKVLTDWTQYLELIDEKLAQAVDQLEQAVLNNSIVIITKN